MSNVIQGAFSSYHQETVELIPQKALLFFSANSSHPYNRSESLVVTAHPLYRKEGASTPIIGAGSLMPEDEIRPFLESMLDKTPEHTGFIPKNVLSISSKHIAWTVSGKTRPMYYRLAGGRKPLRLNVTWPSLLFLATKKKLFIAALKSNRRPTENTKLFHAPLMNIYRDGSVCLGSASLPDTLSLKELGEIEDLIFNTNFSHINHDQTLKLDGNATDKNHLTFWRKLHKTKTQKFPVDALIPLKITVEQFIKTHTK